MAIKSPAIQDLLDVLFSRPGPTDTQLLRNLITAGGRGGAIVVAANDASELTKAQANFTCDGTADDVQIQAAIDELPSGGGKVILSEGTFTLATSIALVANLTLEGQGRATILDYAEDDDGNHMFVGTSGDDNMRLRHFAADGSNAARCRAIMLTSCSDVILEDLYLHDFTGTSDNDGGVIHLNGCDHVKHINVFVKDGFKSAGTLRTRGFFSFNSTDCEWITCRAEGNGYEGMWLKDGTHRALILGGGVYDNGVANQGGEVNVAITLSDHVRVIGLNIRGYAGAYGEHNLEFSLCENSVVTGGVFSGATASGVFLFKCAHCTVDGVHSVDNTDSGILLSSGDAMQGTYNKVTGCTVEGNGQNGINLSNQGGSDGQDDTRVEGNMAVGNTGSGVNVTADSVRTIIKNNTVLGNSGAQIADAGADTVIRDNDGFVTENSGTATLANASTSIAVTHGLDVTPGVGDVMVTPIEAWGAAVNFYIDTYTSTQFTIHVNADPGQDVDFAWKAVVL